MTQAFVAGVRRARVLLGLGVLSLLLAVPATEDLDGLLRWIGYLLLAFGLIVVVSTALSTRDPAHSPADRH